MYLFNVDCFLFFLYYTQNRSTLSKTDVADDSQAKTLKQVVITTTTLEGITTVTIQSKTTTTKTRTCVSNLNVFTPAWRQKAYAMLLSNFYDEYRGSVK